MKGKYMRRLGGILLGAVMLFGVTLATAADAQAQSRKRRVVIVRPNPYRIYRPFGLGYRDWWYYRHWGYDPFGYDPWSPYGFRYRQYVFDNSEEALEKGYERGFKTGKDDGKKAKSHSPQRSDYYKDAGFGNFAEAYRSGFARGYGEGFRVGANERARKNAG